MSDIASPTNTEIKLLIDNALLQNNDKISASIEKQTDKLTKVLTDQMNTNNAQVVALAEKYGALEERQRATESKVSNLGAKMIALGATCTTLGGFAVFLISQMTGK